MGCSALSLPSNRHSPGPSLPASITMSAHGPLYQHGIEHGPPTTVHWQSAPVSEQQAKNRRRKLCPLQPTDLSPTANGLGACATHADPGSRGRKAQERNCAKRTSFTLIIASGLSNQTVPVPVRFRCSCRGGNHLSCARHNSFNISLAVSVLSEVDHLLRPDPILVAGVCPHDSCCHAG